MENVKSRYKRLIIYYLFLFVLETPILVNVGVPSTAIRILYILLLIVPIWILDKRYLPLVIIAAYSISKFGTAVTLMPTEVWYYVPIFVLVAFTLKKTENSAKFKIPSFVLVLCFSIFLSDIITSQSIHEDFLCFLILIALFFYSMPEVNNDFYFMMFSYVFIFTSIILSLEIVLVGDQYLASYGYTDMDRVLWADPNYLGGVIGMGGIAAAILLLRRQTFPMKLCLAGSLLLIVLALVINASRGALLALVAGVLLLLLGREIKVWQKILVIAVAVAFVSVLYNNSYMDLLEYRVENDAGGGSGRIDIWLAKWEVFIDNPTILQIIFGMGFDKGYHAGFANGRAFHNDFLAFIVDYGLVGFIAFVSMFLFPLRGGGIRAKEVLACVVFLLVSCMTLEPFCLGVLVYYFFWLYTCFLSLRYKRN